jgi:hypothetical protein
MADFEDLRMADLVKKVRTDVEKIAECREASLFVGAQVNLQNVYNFHLTSKNSFTECEEFLKNLYSSFNYAAVIINDGIKKGKLSADDNELLGECIEIMLKCCDKTIEILNNK